MKNERTQLGLTDILFDTDGYLWEFEATVLYCGKLEGTVEISSDENGCGDEPEAEIYELVLDRTAFFPEGGGQKSDEGFIRLAQEASNGAAFGEVKVLKVVTGDEGRIIHYTCGGFFEGAKVICRINEDLRLRRMQNHGAEHIVSGLIFSKFGYDNVGFHMADTEVRFDVNGTMTPEEIGEIERRANEIVRKDVPITISFPDYEEARDLTYRSKLDLYDNIRLVTIEGVDVCACCAPHLSSTGQIGVIKITDYMPHRQGMRITMIAGIDAYNDYVMLHEANKKIMAQVSSKREETAEFVGDLLGRNQALKEENSALKREMSLLVTESVMSGLDKREPKDSSPEIIFTTVLDNVGLRNLINACADKHDLVIAGFMGSDRDGYRYIIAGSSAMGAMSVAKSLNEAFGGKGGGSDKMAQGTVTGKQKDIRDYLINMGNNS